MSKQYFYEKNEQQYGPVSEDELFRSGIDEYSYIWYEGLDHWIELRENSTLLMAFKSSEYYSPPLNSHLSQPNHYNDPTKTMPSNYLVLCICSILFGCIPLGIAALYSSFKVKEAFLTKSYEEALKYSNRAKNWSIISIIIGVVFSIIFLYSGYYDLQY